MAEFIGNNKNYNKLKHCNHAVMSRLLYSMLIIYITITNIHSHPSDSLKTAAIKQKIKELNDKLALREATRNPEQEYDSASELYEKRKMIDDSTIIECLSKYQRCKPDPFYDCGKLLYAIANTCFGRARDDYIFKKEEIGFKKRMHKKDSTVVIPPEPKYDFTKTFYYYNLLIDRHPNFEYLNRVYFELHTIARMIKNDSLENLYLDIIIRKFPEDAKRWCLMPPVIYDRREHCIQDGPELDLIRKADFFFRAGNVRKAEKIYATFMEQYQPDTSIYRFLLRRYVNEQILKINKIGSQE